MDYVNLNSCPLVAPAWLFFAAAITMVPRFDVLVLMPCLQEFREQYRSCWCPHRPFSIVCAGWRLTNGAGPTIKGSPARHGDAVNSPGKQAMSKITASRTDLLSVVLG